MRLYSMESSGYEHFLFCGSTAPVVLLLSPWSKIVDHHVLILASRGDKGKVEGLSLPFKDTTLLLITFC